MDSFMLMLASSQEVSWQITLLFAVLLAGLIVALALEEKIHAKKSIIAGTFAIVCLLLGTFTGILSFEQIVVGSHQVACEGDVEVEFSKPVEIEYFPEGKKESTAELAVSDGHSEGAESSDHSKEGLATTDSIHVGGERIRTPVYIPGIDWSVIAIILGSSLFVDVTSKSGLFTWIAIKVTKASAGDPLKLLYFYGFMTVVFSAVLNNVTAMIIVGSLTVVSLEKLGQRKMLLGFLLIEGLLTNIGGLLTLISSVPNIIVGTIAGISFVDVLFEVGPVCRCLDPTHVMVGGKAL